MRIAFSLLLLFFSCVCGYSADFSPLMFAKSMDKTFYSTKGAAFRVSYSSLKVGKYAKIMNVSVPSQIELNNLSVTAFVRNVTDKELNLAKTRVPFGISGRPFALTLQGNENSVKFVSDYAMLTAINSIILKGGVRVVVGKKSVNIGDEATLTLKGRMLYLSFADQKMAFKF